jgi:hypothetical protein
MEKQLVERYRSGIPVVIKRYNTPDLYGGIVGINADCLNNASGVLVLENLNKQLFDEKQDKSLFKLVYYEEIRNIDWQIKPAI